MHVVAPPAARTLLSLALLSALAAAPARAGDHGPNVQLVRPGQSIQAAIDHVRPGGWVLVMPGVYREATNATNGLEITKSLHLVGLSSHGERVVLESTGAQRNAIVAVAADHTSCMTCHSDLAPPFPLRDGVARTSAAGPVIRGLAISGITMRGFSNNGLFARGLDGFAFVDVHSDGNPNYGIFPVSSTNGIITRSSATGADDSGIWVETSRHVKVTHNLVEGNVNGFEISNSEDILLAHNEIRGNTVGIASLFLPDIFGVQPFARRVTIRDNHVHDNNRPNTAHEGAILSTVPPGVGILHVGADASAITGNVVERNDFFGIVVADYCAVVQGGPFDCAVDPDVSPGFVALSEATGNRIADNLVRGNGTSPDPSSPFVPMASDVALLTLGDHGNCYAGNDLDTFFSSLGVLPPCP